MTATPFLKTPARGPDLGFGGGVSNPPAAVRAFGITTHRLDVPSRDALRPPSAVKAYRIATRRCIIASRVTLRLLIAGSKARLKVR